MDQHKLIFSKATELMKSIVHSPVPIIAKVNYSFNLFNYFAIEYETEVFLQVNGFATAAGCQLVATCDMVVCSDSSKFSTPG